MVSTNRYANDPRFKTDLSSMRKTPEELLAEREARKRQQQQSMLGSVAQVALPVAGAIGGGVLGSLGGPGGTMAGATLGGQIGQAAGSAANQGMQNAGEAQLDPEREREMKKMALMQAIMSMPRR
jgi:hypothetical protein